MGAEPRSRRLECASREVLLRSRVPKSGSSFSLEVAGDALIERLAESRNHIPKG